MVWYHIPPNSFAIIAYYESSLGSSASGSAAGAAPPIPPSNAERSIAAGSGAGAAPPNRAYN